MYLSLGNSITVEWFKPEFQRLLKAQYLSVCLQSSIKVVIPWLFNIDSIDFIGVFGFDEEDE